ncbi:MAG: hypothetical protein AAFO69_16940, partial [Bacteroidota bacterium]
MKKSNNNNWKQTVRTATFVALMVLVATFKLSATVNTNDSLKAKKEVSKEEVMMIEDLLEALEEIDALDNIEDESISTVQVYGDNDQLIFTGTQQDWDTQKSAEMITVKRNAELLFEVDGNSIYKV